MLNCKSDNSGNKSQKNGTSKPVWNSSLKRKTPIKRSQKPLKRTAIKSKPKPINKRSAKKIADDKIYAEERVKFLTANPLCLAKLKDCQNISSQVHHKEGRGKMYLVVSTWLPVCGPCHDKINEFSKDAIEKGLSDRRNTEISKQLIT